MVDEVLALKDNEISQQTFNEKLVLHKHKFNTELNTKIKEMLPKKDVSNIGNGYKS